MCPEDFTVCAGQCYSLQRTPGNYEAAERRCAQLNSTLAIPRTVAENLCVAGLADGDRAWVGVTDRQTEGVFLAADGTPLEELSGYRWSSDQPDDTGENEDCVEMNGMGGKRYNAWNDLRCSHAAPMPMCQLV